MDHAKVKSYAKINLGLDVTGKEKGFHTLESAVVTVDISDVISISKRKRDKLVSVTMHGLGSENIPFESNNAARAAQAFIDKYDCCGVDVTVWKNIPMGAGLGGSSADVAGVLRAMRSLFGVDDDAGLKAIADSLGSDCGYMLYGGYACMRGRGDIIEFLNCKMPLDIGVVVPDFTIDTAACFAMYDKMPQASGRCAPAVISAINTGDKERLGQSLKNHLYPCACAIDSRIEGIYEELAAFDPLGVCMTGSGSAVYAIFPNDQFARYAQSRYRGRGRFILTKTKFVQTEDENGRRKAY